MKLKDFFVGKYKDTESKATVKEVEKGRTRYPAMAIGRSALKTSAGYVQEEFLQQLQGAEGVKIYREMSKNDPVIGGILYQINLRLRTAKWNVKAKDDSNESMRLKEIVETSMNEMEYPWNYSVYDMVSALTYGWAIFEQVYGTDPKGNIVLKRLEFRGQTSLDSWKFDEKNIPTTFIQRVPNTFQVYNIPLKNCFHLTTTPSRNNPEGESILRTCYRPWFFKKTIEEIEGIGVERDLSGIPVVQFTSEEFDPLAEANAKIIDYAENMVTAIAKDQMQGIVIYPNMELSILQGHAPSMDPDKIIRRYNQGISIALAGQFMTVAFEARGSGTVSEEYNDLMLDSFDAWTSIFVDMFKSDVVRRLKLYNGLLGGDVEIIPTKLAQRDKEQFAAYISRLVRNGIVIPDDNLEDFIRREANLPLLDKDSARNVDAVVNFMGQEPVEEPKVQPGFAEVRNAYIVECDSDGMTEKPSNNYIIYHKGVVVGKFDAEDKTDALLKAEPYTKLGEISLAHEVGERKGNSVFRKVMSL